MAQHRIDLCTRPGKGCNGWGTIVQGKFKRDQKKRTLTLDVTQNKSPLPLRKSHKTLWANNSLENKSSKPPLTYSYFLVAIMQAHMWTPIWYHMWIFTSETGAVQHCSLTASLRGRRSIAKGKGIRARDHPRGRREEGFLSFLPRTPHSLSRAQIRPSPSPFNTCHAGYITEITLKSLIYVWTEALSSMVFVPEQNLSGVGWT